MTPMTGHSKFHFLVLKTQQNIEKTLEIFNKINHVAVPYIINISKFQSDIAAFIYDVAAVKKIDGVPPPRFNPVFSGFGAFSS